MLASGTAVQRYVVEAPIGEGGMGAVYRARDTHLDRAVALKVLSDGAGGMPDAEARERLVREARAAAALSHPNAVSIFDAGDSEHGPFIVMELVEGDTLRARMSRGVDTPAEIVAWLRAAALALGEAHARGIVHRDVKPENLMVRRDGIVKVLDFGIARKDRRGPDGSAPTQPALPTLTGTGVSIGTPQYMAPEQIKGKPVDGRSDQFAWAVTAYEALAGRSPWVADGALGLVAEILEETPPPLASLRSDLPPRVSAVVARAMAKRPDERFPDMRALVAALDGDEVSAEPTPKRISVRPPPDGAPVHDTRFSEATVKAVIGKALDFDARGGYTRGDLSDAARELGISEAALADATQAIRADRARARASAENEELLDHIRRKRRRGFVHHLIAYVGVNLIIMMPALMKDLDGKIWALFVPGIAWGIGLASHALKAFSSYVSPEEIREELAREERAIAKDAARRAAIAEKLERRARRGRMKRDVEEIGRAVEEGAMSILSAAAGHVRQGGQRVRVDAGPNVRVRAPSDPKPAGQTARSREAEAEAEAEESARRARR